MAIQPIDLQALFTQLDKVGKSQAVQREGQQIQSALQQVQVQRRIEENVQSVNEAQDMGEEAENIRDEHRGRGSNANQGEAGDDGDASLEKETSGNEKPDQKNLNLFRDPALGRNIDISG